MLACLILWGPMLLITFGLLRNSEKLGCVARYTIKASPHSTWWASDIAKMIPCVIYFLAPFVIYDIRSFPKFNDLCSSFLKNMLPGWFEVLTRFAFAILTCLLFPIIGYQIIYIWQPVPRHTLMAADQLAEEKTWSFGQIVPLVLLMLPVMAAVDAARKDEKQNDTKTQFEATVEEIKGAQGQLRGQYVQVLALDFADHV